VTPKGVGIGLLGVLALVFIFQNSSDATLRLLFWEITAPGWIWLLVLFLVGIAVGSMFPWFRRKR
jgi:uncharacterized integral membrane protein